MSIILITGSGGLIGAEAARFYLAKGDTVIGVDNDMRKYFFGEDASTVWQVKALQQQYENYSHVTADIRNSNELEPVFEKYSADISMIIHTAAQPSHDWAAREPMTDFSINGQGTLVILELARKYCPKTVFIYTSTNKVYGDTPNYLPLVEQDKRYEVSEKHAYFKNGIDETMSIDQCKHSLFGVSKAAADMMVQEYGKYFQMKTACFRGGCLTGPGHSGAELHGFLAYLVKCVLTGKNYTIFGYKGKQVRDNIHSFDLVNAFDHFYKNPREGEAYNMGGSRHSNCSMIEAIEKTEAITGKKLNQTYVDENRIGDHIWWISDVSKFKQHFPEWDFKYNIDDILQQIVQGLTERM